MRLQARTCGSPCFLIPYSAPIASSKSSRCAHTSCRWEAHIWIGKGVNKQIYLGGYEKEEHAAEAYDMAALKTKGFDTPTNFSKDRCAHLGFLTMWLQGRPGRRALICCAYREHGSATDAIDPSDHTCMFRRHGDVTQVVHCVGTVSWRAA